MIFFRKVSQFPAPPWPTGGVTGDVSFYRSHAEHPNQEMEAGLGWKHSLRDGCCPFLGLFPSHAQAENLQLLQGKYFTNQPSNSLLAFSTKKPCTCQNSEIRRPPRSVFLKRLHRTAGDHQLMHHNQSVPSFGIKSC